MSRLTDWAPAAILAAGCALLAAASGQQPRSLRQSLTTLPATIEGFVAKDLTIDPAELKVAGPSHYLLRVFQREARTRFSLYVGFYDLQKQGRTIHSPKNCLPGAGWEPVQAGVQSFETAAGRITVNRYLIAKGPAQALVYYWYQGRGRAEANEYRVKLLMLRDAALSHRSDEALVRIVVPIGVNPAETERLGEAAVKSVYPALAAILPN